ncbi:hypothetical protein ACHAWF_003449 [Thalassiosira exigua]
MGATDDEVKACYIYNYVKEEGNWKIQPHHSSVMLEEISMGKSITEDEASSSAFGTIPLPRRIPRRWSPVLLPTVSNTPRTNFASIKDFFVNFLKLKPQGKILESHVTVVHRGLYGQEGQGTIQLYLRARRRRVKDQPPLLLRNARGHGHRLAHHREEGLGIVQLVERRVGHQGSKDGRRSVFQGKIESGNMIVGINWAQDARIYELRTKHSSEICLSWQFTMGATGVKDKVRYTFVYVFEDGQWN